MGVVKLVAPPLPPFPFPSVPVPTISPCSAAYTAAYRRFWGTASNSVMFSTHFFSNSVIFTTHYFSNSVIFTTHFFSNSVMFATNFL